MKDNEPRKQLNVEISLDFHRDIKLCALLDNMTLQDWVVSALQSAVDRRKTPALSKAQGDTVRSAIQELRRPRKKHEQ